MGRSECSRRYLRAEARMRRCAVTFRERRALLRLEALSTKARFELIPADITTPPSHISVIPFKRLKLVLKERRHLTVIKRRPPARRGPAGVCYVRASGELG